MQKTSCRSSAACAERFRRIPARDNFKAWFMRILTNVFYARGRRARVAGHTVSLDDTPPLYLYSKTAAAGWHSGDTNPAATFFTKLETEQVLEALQSLPLEYRRSPRCTSWRTYRTRRSPRSSTARWAQCGRACTAHDGSSSGPFGHSQRTTDRGRRLSSHLGLRLLPRPATVDLQL